MINVTLSNFPLQTILQTDFVNFNKTLFYYGNACIIDQRGQKIEDFLKYVATTLHWKPQAKYIIISDENPQEIFKCLSPHFVINVIVLYPKSSKMVEIYSYNLFGENGEILYPVSKLLDVCIEGVLQENIDLFPNKLPKNWSKMEVRADEVTFLVKPFKGRSALEEVMNIIAKKTKYTLTYVDLKPNRSYFFHRELLSNCQIHMAFTDNLQLLDQVYPHTTDRLFMTHLTVYMTTRSFDRQLDTIEDLVKSGLKIGIREGVSDIDLFQSNSSIDNYIRMNHYTCHNFEQCLGWIADEKNVTCLAMIHRLVPQEQKPYFY
ncbi:uncharacterized protein LOC112905351 [Agrilus planipennis]|uniref:Uncharacterized protein LOC112905351 n=1 Tax=Agrilus planipennis TaxID=224129 RepID=A0A7F5RBK1_AGRPL|nr:uncharacterized protein LOC112905351 [Agrilus planipennis]